MNKSTFIVLPISVIIAYWLVLGAVIYGLDIARAVLAEAHLFAREIGG